MSMRTLTSTATIAVAIALLAIPISASASPANPYLHVSPETAKRALHCTPGWRHQRGEPVLLVHGTATTAEQTWGSNYLIALPEAGLGVCTVVLPRRALGDIQHAAEYVVRAIRFMARRSGGKVDVVGHSQGTLEPRWAVKWWRSARRRTDDLVLLASPSHGTASATGLCLPGVCEAAAWQMNFGSEFLKALNRGDESPGRVDITSIYSQLDDLVQPPKTARLDGASNVDLQALCPARPISNASGHQGVPKCSSRVSRWKMRCSATSWSTETEPRRSSSRASASALSRPCAPMPGVHPTVRLAAERDR